MTDTMQQIHGSEQHNSELDLKTTAKTQQHRTDNMQATNLLAIAAMGKV